MLVIQKPRKVKLIFGFIFSSPQICERAEKALIRKFGALDYTSKTLDFSFTDYYEEEMGTNLKRKFISCKKLINPENLTEIKLFAISLEKRFSILGKRRLNIDPGYINESKLVLSTTKDFSHRIYLGKGIFSEVTLLYKNKGFQNLAWTFPDYRTKTYKEILLKIRSLYRKQINPERSVEVSKNSLK